jgi:hypothetical protein
MCACINRLREALWKEMIAATWTVHGRKEKRTNERRSAYGLRFLACDKDGSEPGMHVCVYARLGSAKGGRSSTARKGPNGADSIWNPQAILQN